MSKRLGAIRTDPMDSAHYGGLRYVRGEAGPGIVRRSADADLYISQPTANASGIKQL